MELILPSGVSDTAFRQALAAFADIVGPEWVLATDEDRTTYLDLYAPGAEDERAHAPAAGVVVIADEIFSTAANYGTVIVLDHGGGWQTLYAHLDSMNVAVGDAVAQGEVIGGLGSTGQATGPHVHVEVLKDGVRMDPMTVIGTPVAAK